MPPDESSLIPNLVPIFAERRGHPFPRSIAAARSGPARPSRGWAHGSFASVATPRDRSPGIQRRFSGTARHRQLLAQPPQTRANDRNRYWTRQGPKVPVLVSTPANPRRLGAHGCRLDLASESSVWMAKLLFARGPRGGDEGGYV